MLKNEFEKLVKKEVDQEVFEMYNAMYMALPDNYDKQAFVKMLNIKAIPTASAVIEQEEARKDMANRLFEIGSFLWVPNKSFFNKYSVKHIYNKLHTIYLTVRPLSKIYVKCEELDMVLTRGMLAKYTEAYM